MSDKANVDINLQQLIASRDQAVRDLEKIKEQNTLISLALVIVAIIALVLAWRCVYSPA